MQYESKDQKEDDASVQMAREIARLSGFQWCGSKKSSVYSGVIPGGLGCVMYQVEGNRLLAVADVLELAALACPSFKMLMDGPDFDLASANINPGQLLEDRFVQTECICFKFPARFFSIMECQRVRDSIYNLEEKSETLETIITCQDASCALRDLHEESPLSEVRSLRIAYCLPGDLVYVPFGSLICEKSCGTSHNIAARVFSCLVTAHHHWHSKLMSYAYPRCHCQCHYQ